MKSQEPQSYDHQNTTDQHLQECKVTKLFIWVVLLGLSGFANRPKFFRWLHWGYNGENIHGRAYFQIKMEMKLGGTRQMQPQYQDRRDKLRQKKMTETVTDKGWWSKTKQKQALSINKALHNIISKLASLSLNSVQNMVYCLNFHCYKTWDSARLRAVWLQYTSSYVRFRVTGSSW